MPNDQKQPQHFTWRFAHNPHLFDVLHSVLGARLCREEQASSLCSSENTEKSAAP